ncbi:hypothetical protein TorRG33x02_146250 [Trema orientale]|uniref:CDR ABC transporter domain-containing protein n=1 Tax=Trema orientale TaxID=63057 RepID=A0A2P5EVS7_TREOI|nr:hypothetical protein TorRG33x02_146250 [Trema orientale]
MYAYQGLFKNEFEGLVYPGEVVGRSNTISGEEILRDIWQVEMAYSKWVDLFVLIGMALFYRILFLVIIKITEKGKNIIAVLSAARRKPSIQIMENPIATPLHGDNNYVVAL